MPVAEVKPGSTWERLTLRAGNSEDWILRDNETGEVVACAQTFENSIVTWMWTLLLSERVIGCTLGHTREMVLGEVEKALEVRGCLHRPIVYAS